jgi:hypothetical protein
MNINEFSETKIRANYFIPAIIDKSWMFFRTCQYLLEGSALRSEIVNRFI